MAHRTGEFEALDEDVRNRTFIAHLNRCYRNTTRLRRSLPKSEDRRKLVVPILRREYLRALILREGTYPRILDQIDTDQHIDTRIAPFINELCFEPL